MLAAIGELRHALRYEGWATLALIDHCGKLSKDQLSLTSPGTYGLIEQTLAHLVGSQEFYIYALTGRRPTEPLQPMDDVDLDAVRRHASAARALLDQLAAEGVDPDSEAHSVWRGSRRRGVIAAQLLSHGAEHRGQVNSILGARGIELADIAVRAFSVAEGLQAG